MVLLKNHELARCKQGIDILSNRQEISYPWPSVTRSYFKNDGFDVTNIKLINKDTCKQFRVDQRNDNENYVLNFYSTGRIAINSK